VFNEFLTAVKELYHSSDEKGGEGKEEGARLAVAGGADRGINFFPLIFLKQNCLSAVAAGGRSSFFY